MGKPYRCKLCLVEDQSSKHYMMDCEYLNKSIFKNREDQIKKWKLLRNLDGNKRELEELAESILSIIKQIKTEDEE